MWAGLDQQREQIRQAGLELAPGELLAAATGRGARLEGITAVLLLTDEDDFNALASVLLTDSVDGPRLPARAAAAQPRGRRAVHRRGDPVRRRPDQAGGQRPVRRRRADHRAARRRRAAAGYDLLFLVRADGQLLAVTTAGTPVPEAGDTIVSLGPVPGAQTTDGLESP